MPLLTILVLLIGMLAHAQSMPRSTTLRAETSNNTSAVRGQPQAANSDPANISKLSTRNLLYPGANTAILVRWMPWFGDEHHIDVGYHSDDPAQIDRQVADMRSRGIDGAIVDWYGPSQSFKNRATQRLLESAERHSGFKVAISVDSGALKQCKASCDATQLLIDDLSYVITHFAKSPAYVRFDGRPLITFFGLEKQSIDWNSVRQRVSGNPMFIFRNSGAFELLQSDGGFSWIAPETVTPDDPLAFRYIERFHKTAVRYPNKPAIGSVYKGFDDRLAGWGKGRRIDQRCGQTWLDSFAELNRFYSAKHQLPALIIVTWNDYEEGTEIETGIDNCMQLKLRVEGNDLTWDVTGSRSTIDHYVVFDSSDGINLRNAAELPPDRNSIDLKSLHLPAGAHQLFVKAIGKPSIQNHIAGPVTFRASSR